MRRASSSSSTLPIGTVDTSSYRSREESLLWRYPAKAQAVKGRGGLMVTCDIFCVRSFYVFPCHLSRHHPSQARRSFSTAQSREYEGEDWA